MSLSPARAPARRLGVKHPLQNHHPSLHLARRLVKFAKAALVLGRELPAAAPAREVVRDDPDRRDDDREDNPAAKVTPPHRPPPPPRPATGRAPLPLPALPPPS